MSRRIFDLVVSDFFVLENPFLTLTQFLLQTVDWLIFTCCRWLAQGLWFLQWVCSVGRVASSPPCSEAHETNCKSYFNSKSNIYEHVKEINVVDAKSSIKYIVEWYGNLYLGGSSGNRGFRGPACSDLLFFEPDILQLKCDDILDDNLNIVLYWIVGSKLMGCTDPKASLTGSCAQWPLIVNQWVDGCHKQWNNQKIPSFRPLESQQHWILKCLISCHKIANNWRSNGI